jgi:ATP-dependent RNA helicase DHX29
MFTIPEEHDINSTNDIVINSVVAWSFYPKLITREGKGWRNVANNQSVTLHPTSINKHANHAIKWLSYYHIMQARNRNLNAHDTSAVDDFAIALLCGDAEFKVRPYLPFLFPVPSLSTKYYLSILILIALVILGRYLNRR